VEYTAVAISIEKVCFSVFMLENRFTNWGLVIAAVSNSDE
jgi:hypothetical protein